MQALIITAYKDMEQLLRIIDEVKDRCWIYIHIDTKSHFYETIKQEVEKRNLERIYLESHYSITWGGYNHLIAILDLLRKAIANSNVNYIHIISGQDYFANGFEQLQLKCENSDTIYMTCYQIDDCDIQVRKRLYYPIISSNFDARNPFFKMLNNVTTLLQKTFKHKRARIGQFEDVYKGMVWVSFPRKAAEYCIEYSDINPLFLRSLFHTFIPEEFFFQTILMNSPFKNYIVNDNLRYTVWEYRNGGCPAILDDTDYEGIAFSNCLFVRKIDTSISKGLLDKLKGQNNQ